MIFFDVIILLLSLIARKKCTKGKYVFFMILYVIALLINGICLVDFYIVYPNNPYMAGEVIASMQTMAPVCAVGLVIDVIGIVLLQRWRTRYLQATMGEEALRQQKKNSWKWKLALILVPFGLFAGICAAGIISEGSLPFAQPVHILLLFAAAAIAWFLLARRNAKQEEVSSGALLVTNLASGIAICLLIVLLAYPMSGMVGPHTICPSCGKTARLITQKDAVGDSHSWCQDCWNDYWAIMR